MRYYGRIRRGDTMCAKRVTNAPPPHIEQPVRLKDCLRCKGDLAWQLDEWVCIQCGRVRK